MNVTQLRAAFALTTRLQEQIAQFRRDRTEKIKRNSDVPLTTPPAPTVILHLIPFESFRSGFGLEVQAAMSAGVDVLHPLGNGIDWAGFNLDGVYSTDNSTSCDAYTQIFRNGIIESANRLILIPLTARKFIPCGLIIERVLIYVRSCMAFYRKVSVPPPLALVLTILNIRDYDFAKGAESCQGVYSPVRVDRNDLEFPITLVEDLNQSPVEICRPIFDALYNAAGSPRWPDYEEWKRKFRA